MSAVEHPLHDLSHIPRRVDGLANLGELVLERGPLRLEVADGVVRDPELFGELVDLELLLRHRRRVDVLDVGELLHELLVASIEETDRLLEGLLEATGHDRGSADENRRTVDSVGPGPLDGLDAAGLDQSLEQVTHARARLGDAVVQQELGGGWCDGLDGGHEVLRHVGVEHVQGCLGLVEGDGSGGLAGHGDVS